MSCQQQHYWRFQTKLQAVDTQSWVVDMQFTY